MPSVYEDPLPRAVMEAMAMSKPVIAFRMGGIGEMIDDGVYWSRCVFLTVIMAIK